MLSYWLWNAPSIDSTTERFTAFQAGLAPGKMVKICPHNSTGRADYFGAVVNRAARLLCAAKPGQVLVEEQVMESVIKEWTKSGVSAISDAQPLAGSVTNRPSYDAHLKRLVGFSTLFQPTRTKESPLAGPAATDRVDQTPAPLQPPPSDAFELSSRSRSVPLNAIRRMNILGGSPGPSKVTFEGLSNNSSPRNSLDGSSRLGSLDLATPTDQVLESSCVPYAAKIPLAVSNCHMLNFLHASGLVLGRKESGILHGKKYLRLGSSVGQDVDSSRKVLSSAGNSLDPGFKMSLSLLDKHRTADLSFSKGWVQDESHSDKDSNSSRPASIASVPVPKGNMSICSIWIIGHTHDLAHKLFLIPGCPC